MGQEGPSLANLKNGGQDEGIILPSYLKVKIDGLPIRKGTVDGRNPAPVEVGSLSHYLQGFIHPRWCRISSINSRFVKGPKFHQFVGTVSHLLFNHCMWGL